MNIGIDAGSLAVREEKQKLGVYQMTFNLLRQLGQIDRKNHYWLYSFASIKKRILAELDLKMKNIIAKPAKGWRYFGLPFRLFLRKPDIFLGPSQALPILCPCPSVVIIHDLAFEHLPECYPDGGRRLKKLTKHAVGKADKIIAVSEATKRDLISVYQVPEEKIEVVYEGYDPIFKTQSTASIKKINQKYKLGKPYFLFVGSLKKSKNIPRILIGLARFSKSSKKDFRLVLVGSSAEQDGEIGSQIRRLDLKDRVKFLGYVPRSDLPGLYGGATAFVSPSLYEGFGLPMLEAIACGTPVVTSRAGSIPEIVGEAAVLVNPKKPAEIAEAFNSITTSKRLCRRLSKKGLEQAKKFSWDKFARGVLRVINSLPRCEPIP